MHLGIMYTLVMNSTWVSDSYLESFFCFVSNASNFLKDRDYSCTVSHTSGHRVMLSDLLLLIICTGRKNWKDSY